MNIIAWIYFLIYFIFRFLWHVIVYTLSVLPASACDACGETKNRIHKTGSDDDTRPPTFKKDQSNYHRKRRGHRGGRKHRKFHN
jgi:hypothetical protein